VIRRYATAAGEKCPCRASSFVFRRVWPGACVGFVRRDLWWLFRSFEADARFRGARWRM